MVSAGFINRGVHARSLKDVSTTGKAVADFEQQLGPVANAA